MIENWQEPEWTECDSLEQDIGIAKINLNSARAEVSDREEELELLNAKLYKLQFGIE